MPDHDAVAAALARLANGTAPSAVQPAESTRATDPSDSPAPAAVVAEVADAFERLSTAAAFVDGGGERQLSRAVAAAAADGDDQVAERGRELLVALEGVRTAAEGHGPRATDEGEPAPPDRDRPADHFHSGRATLLAGDGVAPER